MGNNLTDAMHRMIENEAVFRRYNERVSDNVEYVERQAEAHGQAIEGDHKQLAFHFYCECSDENCRKRIEMTLDDYSKIHRNRRHFIVVPGHQADTVESVIEQAGAYVVVKKHVRPPENPEGMKTTPVNNV